MNENIDLTNILNNCPKDWKFYSVVHGDVYFRRFYSLDKILFTYNKDAEYDNDLITDNYGKLADTGECIVFPSKDQRDWSKFDAPWYKKDKFDPNTFQPFDRVIVRDVIGQNWECGIFSHIEERDDYKFMCTGSCYCFCIPYNEHTKHLVGTTDEAPEYYRYWEE